MVNYSFAVEKTTKAFGVELHWLEMTLQSEIK